MNQKNSKATQKGIRIVQSFDCIDLRTITSQSAFLQETIKKYHMQHLDAVLYTNQLITRFRLVMAIDGVGFLCIPEIDEMSKHSLYLKISEVLSRLSGVSHVVVNIKDISSKIRDRVDRQEQREQNRLALHEVVEVQSIKKAG
jgi:hypothetical protein